jgi:hypothetical protein
MDRVDLPRSREALGRAQRMLDDLARHSADVDALRDRLPYVLDLLSGVTRVIDAESRGHRSTVFSAWWNTVDRSAQGAIQEMRNAELKRLESRTTLSTTTKTAVRAIDYPDLRVADGDTVTRITWVFDGGGLHGRPVFETLRDYLQRVIVLVEEAEQRLGS